MNKKGDDNCRRNYNIVIFAFFMRFILLALLAPWCCTEKPENGTTYNNKNDTEPTDEGCNDTSNEGGNYDYDSDDEEDEIPGSGCGGGDYEYGGENYDYGDGNDGKGSYEYGGENNEEGSYEYGGENNGDGNYEYGGGNNEEGNYEYGGGNGEEGSNEGGNYEYGEGSSESDGGAENYPPQPSRQKRRPHGPWKSSNEVKPNMPNWDVNAEGAGETRPGNPEFYKKPKESRGKQRGRGRRNG